MMARSLCLILVSCLAVLVCVKCNPEVVSLSGAHKELSSYGFPVGLLPSDILDYSINSTTGDFSLNFGHNCKITLPPDNYVATFFKTVRGKIVKNKITELDGISVRAFFKSWSITGIRSSGDQLVFEVGMVTAKYGKNNFDKSPACEGGPGKADS